MIRFSFHHILIVCFCVLTTAFVKANGVSDESYENTLSKTASEHNEPESISPLDFGLRTATTGEDRYWALYNAHVTAIKTGKPINYNGVGDISIVIPKDAKWIPLTDYNDFCGITITVENKNVDIALFSMVKKGKPLIVEQSLLDRGDFSSINGINTGYILLILEDNNPWVVNRTGYDYGATRRDILLLKNGVAMNKPIMEWGDKVTTKPTSYFIITNNRKKVVKNLRVIRTESSTKKTKFISVEGQNNILIENISIITPDNDEMYGDQIFSISNSTNVVIKDVIINGTYSQKNKFGYAFSLENTWKTTFVRFVADGKWGVFGNNNVNDARLQNCKINRFDIHCYGRDVYFKDCEFLGLYNQFSSTYGVIRYDNCIFKEHTPYLNEFSYNCFVPFDLVMNNCTWYPTTKIGGDAICIMGELDEIVNSRLEVRQRALPNVKIHGLTIIPPVDTMSLYVFNISGKILDERPITYIKKVQIKKMKIVGNSRINLCNQSLLTEKPIRVRIKPRSFYVK